MNKDVLYTIYEIIHRDLTKQLIDEYHKRLGRCCVNSTICNNVCQCHITIKHDDDIYTKVYNYRSHNGVWWINVYTKSKKVRCCISANY